MINSCVAPVVIVHSAGEESHCKDSFSPPIISNIMVTKKKYLP